MSKSIFLKNPKISFPNQNPTPQTIEPTPRILTIECSPGEQSPSSMQKNLMSASLRGLYEVTKTILVSVKFKIRALSLFV